MYTKLILEYATVLLAVLSCAATYVFLQLKLKPAARLAVPSQYVSKPFPFILLILL